MNNNMNFPPAAMFPPNPFMVQQLQLLQTEVERQKALVQQRDQQIVALKTQLEETINTKEQEKYQLECELATHNDTIANLKQELEGHQSQIKKCQKDLDKKTNKIKMLQQDNKKKQKQQAQQPRLAVVPGIDAWRKRTTGPIYDPHPRRSQKKQTAAKKHPLPSSNKSPDKTSDRNKPPHQDDSNNDIIATVGTITIDDAAGTITMDNPNHLLQEEESPTLTTITNEQNADNTPNHHHYHHDDSTETRITNDDSSNLLERGESPVTIFQDNAASSRKRTTRELPTNPTTTTTTTATAKKKPKVEKATWEERFQELKAYQQANGHTRVSRHDNLALWNWCKKQRCFYKNYLAAVNGENNNDDNDNFTDRQRRRPIIMPEGIAQLQSLGFEWNERQAMYDKSWEEKYTQLLHFKAEFGHTQVPLSKTHHRLAEWVRVQRSKLANVRNGQDKGRGFLTDERIKRLESLGM